MCVTSTVTRVSVAVRMSNESRNIRFLAEPLKPAHTYTQSHTHSYMHGQRSEWAKAYPYSHTPSTGGILTVSVLVLVQQISVLCNKISHTYMLTTQLTRTLLLAPTLYAIHALSHSLSHSHDHSLNWCAVFVLRSAQALRIWFISALFEFSLATKAKASVWPEEQAQTRNIWFLFALTHAHTYTHSCTSRQTAVRSATAAATTFVLVVVRLREQQLFFPKFLCDSLRLLRTCLSLALSYWAFVYCSRSIACS